MVTDETRISIESNSYYVWHQQGETPVKKAKLEIHKSRVIYGGLSLRKNEVISCQTGTHKGIDTVKFLDQVKAFKQIHYRNSCQPILLIWDGASCHKNQAVKEWLRMNPKIVELDYFPPYSPELNPQEYIWMALKKHINHLRGSATLSEIMTEAEQFLKNNKFFYKLFSKINKSIFN